MASKVAKNVLPKVLAFDLDGCVWDPEMYQMWGGGAPFKSINDGEYLTDIRGQRVVLLADVRSIMNELKTNSKWSNTIISVASRCNEPQWADECINKFSIGNGFKLKDLFVHSQIYEGSKSEHMKAISKKTGVPLKDMIFFDDRYDNCQDVASIGVTVLYTPDGLTRDGFEQVIGSFPSPGLIFGPKKPRYW